MKIRTMALIGAAVAVLGGVSVVACSSSDNTGNPSNPTDGGGGGNDSAPAGNDSGPVTGDDDDSGQPQGDDDAGGADGAANCKIPGLHVPVPDGGIYCPYSFNDATDAGTQYCTNGVQQCCLSPGGDAGPSTCETFDNTTFNGGKSTCPAADLGVWQCASPADCVGNGPALPIDGGAPTTGATVCCLVGGSLASESATCSQYQKTHFGGTSCQPADACHGSVTIGTFTDPLYVACEQDSDCTGAGQTCTAIFTTGTSIGVCLPLN